VWTYEQLSKMDHGGRNRPPSGSLLFGSRPESALLTTVKLEGRDQSALNGNTSVTTVPQDTHLNRSSNGGDPDSPLIKIKNILTDSMRMQPSEYISEVLRD